MTELDGQVALISGGSTELARAVAAALAEAGASVGLCGRSTQLVEECVAALQADGRPALALPADLDDLESAEKVAQRVLTSFKRLDILVIVSPFFAGGQIHSLPPRVWDAVLAANLREAFLLLRAVLPSMRQRGAGQILAISSDSALGAYAQDGAYGVAMHALNALIEQVRVENAAAGIRAHILCPGLALAPNPAASSALSTRDVAAWAVWALTRPPQERPIGPILI